MTSPDDGIRFLAPLAFKAADKFFKFVTWAFAIAAIQVALKITGNDSLKWLYSISVLIYTTSLLLQCFYLAIRDPSTLNVPKSLHGASKIVQFVVGASFAMVLASPALHLDQIIEAIIQSRPK